MALGVFVAYGLVDALYALYTLATVQRRALRAATYSVATYLLLGSGVIAFAHSAWYLLPAAAGGFLGTYLTVRRGAE